MATTTALTIVNRILRKHRIDDVSTFTEVEPKHKFNLGSSFTFNNGFCFDVRTHYVDETTWRPVVGRRVDIDDYVRLDVRIAQKLFKDKVEIPPPGRT